MQRKREWEDLMVVGGWSNQITGFLRAGPSFSETERAQIPAESPASCWGLWDWVTVPELPLQ